MNKLLTLVLVFSVLACLSPKKSHYEIGKNYHEVQKYSEAISEYWKHIKTRLAVKNRPEWENPYIYLLDIGDIYLEMSDVEKALEHYHLAEDKKVKAAYVNDRFRYVASWYEKQGQLEKAMEILVEYQDRDPELFNLILDRLAKEIVRNES